MFLAKLGGVIMRKNTKIVIAILAIVISALMILPMITALIPQRGVSSDDVYYADEDEELHGEEDPELSEVREIYRESLRDILYAIEEADKTGDETDPDDRAREITELGDTAGYDREATESALSDVMSIVEERETYIEKFKKVYDAYKEHGEEREVMEVLYQALDSYR